jgi:hypothetical protein
MAEEPLPQDIQILVSRHLSSIDHVAMVIALAARNGIPADSGSLAGAASLAEPAADAALSDLVASGLVTESEAGFSIALEHPEIAPAALLSEAYNRNPIAVIKAIYERPASSAKSFAEAFRIRRVTE